MTNEATNKIELMIERTRERAKQAEKRFDMSTDLIQKKASHSIDLFAGSAVSQVSDIAAESRKACDDLYASYQSLIVSLDEYCRPLLAEKPDASAVKNIAELMRWLNDESEIENNFTASLNGSSLGGVASGRYYASVECKMIQRYWEDKYHDMPEVIEAEEKNKKAEAVRRAEMEEKRKEQEKEAEEKYKREQEIYNQALSKWDEEVKRIKALREEKVREKEKEIEQKRKDIDTKTREEYNKCIDELSREIKKHKVTIYKAEKELNELGFFAFGKKSECKKRIQNEKERLDALSIDIEHEKGKYDQKNVENAKLIKKMKQNVDLEIEEKYPLPVKPSEPRKTKEIRSHVSRDGMTAVQIANECIKDEILDFLSDGTMYTIPEMQEQCFTLGELSNQRVSALVRQLMTEGKVERIEYKRQAYFKLI